MIKFIVRVLRASFIAALGTAVAAKFLLQSNAEPETEEIDMVSIFEGNHLVSSADPFYGGQVFTMFGGVLVDLRTAHPAPTGIHLNVAIILGGLSIVVPEGWRVIFDGEIYLGGWSDETKTTADADAPTVMVTGYVLMGGLRAATKSPVEAVT